MVNLTIEDIIKLADNGWVIEEVSIKKRPPQKGDCLVDEYKIEIYTNHLENIFDYDVTIIHECLHAKYPELDEKTVESRANYLARNDKDIAEFIVNLFRLKRNF